MKQNLLKINRKGFSLVEVLLAVALFGMIVATLSGSFLYGQESTMLSGKRVQANFLVDEAIEAVRSIKNGAWNEIIYNQSAVGISGNQWILSGEGTNETIGDYTRSVVFEDVCRDGSDNIVNCPGSYTDIYTKKITASVSWDEVRVGNKTVSREEYITNWDSSSWLQTNWIGGDGQDIWSDETQYLSDDGNVDVSDAGEVKLESVGGACTGHTWSFDDAGNYNFDSGKIEVISGSAQLTSVGGIVNGGTVNPGFDSSAASWTSGQWAYSSGEYSANNTISYYGNPSWWVYDYLRVRDSAQVGGYWQQPFQVTADTINNVTINLDYQQWYETLQTGDEAWFYVFIESTSGAPSSPVNAAWGQQMQMDGPTRVWTEGTVIDATSAITAPGTYYLKVALWLETIDGPRNNYRYAIGGFDNALLSWSGTYTSYPSDAPSIRPVDSYKLTQMDSWTTFTETATKNGGEIYYQISDDDGSTWQYWNGSNWVVAGASNYNTANVIDNNLWEFDATENKIMFKAFLEGDGSQQVILDEIEVGCANLQMEAGSIKTDENWEKIETLNTYADPVIVASYQESENSLPASVRIRNLTASDFEIRLQHPSDRDLRSDQINYLVMERGKWELDTIKIEADKYETNTVGNKGDWDFDSVNFLQNFSTDPIVFHQVMTSNDNRWISTYVSRNNSQSNPPNTAGMRIALNGAEVTNSHAEETIGWIAIERNQVGKFGDGVEFETYRTNDSVRGHDNDCYRFGYQNSYSSAPLVFGTQLEMDGGDGGWSVTCQNSSSEAGFHAEEDQEQNNERSHTTEIFGFMAFNEEFSFTGESSGYATSGELVSSAYDMGSNARALQSIEWDEINPGCALCAVGLQIRSAPTQAGLSSVSWGSSYSNYLGNILPVSHNGNRWVQYRATLTGDGNETPTIEEIRVNYK